MAEAGCLKDVAVQNLEVRGNTSLAGATITNSGAVVQTSSTLTANINAIGNYRIPAIVQPANTILRDLICIVQGANMTTGNANTNHVTLALGTTAGGNEISNAVNLLNNGGAQVTWPQNKPLYLISNAVPYAVNAFNNTNLGATGPATSAALAGQIKAASSLHSAAQRNVHLTFSVAGAVLATTPTAIKVIAVFQYV